VESVVHCGLLFQIERVHGAHQNFERIARKRFFALVVQAQSNASPIRLGSLSDKYPPASSALMACDAVPRVVA
jgi:hypothetical protein